MSETTERSLVSPFDLHVRVRRKSKPTMIGFGGTQTRPKGEEYFVHEMKLTGKGWFIGVKLNTTLHLTWFTADDFELSSRR